MSWLTAFAALLAVPAVSLGANHYVWCGASGANNGTEWTDAYTDLPSSLVRGDTYYVAGSTSCTYGGYTFDDATSGTEVISIIKATAANSGSVAGWQSSFGTSTADWDTDGWDFESSYYTVEGSYGTSPDAGSFGFRIRFSSQTGDLITVSNNLETSNISLDHIELDGVSAASDSNGTVGEDGIYINPTYGTEDFTLKNSYIHDIWGPILATVYTGLFDHLWLARNDYSGGSHAEGFSLKSGSNLTISNCVLQDIIGTGGIVMLEGTFTKIYIYNNLFFNSGTYSISNYDESQTYGNGIISDNAGSGTVNGAYILNNTAYNISGFGGIQLYGSDTNVVQENNLFWNDWYVQALTGGTGNSEGYNTIINSSLQYAFTCGSTDKCYASTNASGGNQVSSVSISSGVATVTANNNTGLSAGSEVLVIGTQAGSTSPCGADTIYPYPTISAMPVVSSEFTYSTSSANATCESGGYGVVASPVTTAPFVSPVSSPYNFALTSDTVISGLNTGTNLTSLCSSWKPPCNVDPNSTTRPATGGWDVGAYQHSGQTAQAPAAPTSLAATVH